MKMLEARETIAFLVIALFSYAFVVNPKEQLMIGALIGSFTTAVGFYLGGSKVGSDTATKNADTLADAAKSVVPPITHEGEGHVKDS